jgi:hypothetical protein
MAAYELLVRTVDKVQPKDPILDAKLMKRGDVIHIAPAGHQWTKRELTNPEWTIIKVDINKQLLLSLLAPEIAPDLLKEYQMLRPRGVKIDLETLKFPVFDGRGDLSKQLSGTEVVSAVALKPRLIEPDAVVVESSSEVFLK